MLCCASWRLITHRCKPEPEHIVLRGKHINKSVLWPQNKSHVLNLYCIFSLILLLLFIWMWVVITTSSPSLATDNWVGRECNGKQKHCHRHHPWHIFLWPQYSSGRLNNIDSCAQLQPNNNIFQVRTLKALNTAVFCNIEMYQYFKGTCCIHHSWSYSVTSRLLPDCTVLHLRRQQCSPSQLWPSQILYTKTLIKEYDKTDPVLTWKKIDMENIIIHL